VSSSATSKAEDHKSDGEHHGMGRYVLVWLALLVGTLVTVFTGRMDLGSANLPIALIIASTKALLVVLFFMHLWESTGINRLIFSVSVVFVLVLLAGVFGDIGTRNPMTLPFDSTVANPHGTSHSATGVHHAE